MAARTLLVRANPAHALDGEGRPHAAVQHESSNGTSWVAARIDLRASVKAGRTIFEFTGEAERVAFSAYYLRKLEGGELLPGDQETADAAKVPFAATTDPAPPSSAPAIDLTTEA